LKRFLKNLSANSVGIFINLFAQLFSIPLFLHNWNKELYGEWLVLTAVPNLLWSLEGGLGILAASRMTLAAAVRDWKAANEIFQTTLLSQILISMLLWVSTLAFALSTKVSTSFGFRRISNSDASFILVVMITYMLLGLMMSVYRAAYRASELEARGSMLLNFWRASDLLIIIVVLSFHGTSVRLAECMLVGIFVWVALGYVDVRRKCKNVRFGFKSISWMRLKEMVIHGLPVLVGQVTTALYMQGFPLVVNRSLGAATVVTLTTVRTVSRLGLLPIQTVAFSSSPQLSRSYGSQDRALFGRLLKIMATACLWSALGVTIGLSSFGPWLISKWTGGRLTVDHTTICLFALSVSFQGVWTCCMVTLGSCNRHHLFNYAYFCVIAIALGAAVFLTKPFGFKVIPITMLTADVVVATIGLYLCKTKITYFDPRELLCVFQFSFYKTVIFKIITERKMKRRASLEEENRARDLGGA
jgi:O-antigen/teichoic acid export membrane protein